MTIETADGGEVLREEIARHFRVELRGLKSLAA